MTKYYGVMVDLPTGDVDDLEVDSDIEKPQEERIGRYTVVKWFKSIKKRDDAKRYLKWYIDFRMKNGREPSYEERQAFVRQKRLKA